MDAPTSAVGASSTLTLEDLIDRAFAARDRGDQIEGAVALEAARLVLLRDLGPPAARLAPITRHVLEQARELGPDVVAAVRRAARDLRDQVLPARPQRQATEAVDG